MKHETLRLLKSVAAESINNAGIATAILNSANFSIISTRPDGIIEWFNLGAEQLLEYRSEEVCGQTTPEIIHDITEVENRAKILSAELGKYIEPGFRVFVEKADLGIPDENEWTYISKSGRRFPVSLSVTAMRNPQTNEIIGYLGIAKDLTAQKKAEELERRSFQELSNIKLALDKYAIVSMTDKKGIITYANDKFCEISKYSREELLNQSHKLLNSGYHSKKFFKDLWQVISSGKPWQGELRNKNKNGDYYFVDTIIVPILDKNQKPHQYVSIRTDITQRVNSEQKIKEMLKELKRSNKDLSEFAYVVSHDLKAPLRGINSIATWIKEDYIEQLGQNGISLLDNILQRVDKLEELINGILEYSKIGNHELEYTPVDLGSLIKELLLTITIPSHIQIHIDTPFATCSGEKTRLFQLFQNLLTNAIKFTPPPKGEIHIGCREVDDMLQFYVKDNGIGIEEKNFKKIFQLFQTISPNDATKGTGIGLAIVKKIIEHYGGEICLESEVGKGTTVYFSLEKNAKNTPIIMELNT